MLKELKREHHVTYLTLDDGTAGEDARARSSEYCHELVRVPHSTRTKFTAGFYAELAGNVVSRLPYALAKYESAEMRREVERLASGGEFDVLVCDFLTPAVNLPAQVPCATVLFQHNVEAMIWRRHYETQRNPLKKAYLYEQWRKTHAFEREACRHFDYVVAVSREDRDLMEREYGVKAITDIPTGVDTEFFRPSGEGPQEAHELVFTGSMDWLPNEDAIRFFNAEIMPRVKREMPDATLTVVGRNPSQGLVALAESDVSIKVTGRVEDVRPYLERAALFVVPIRIGGGTRLKIYEAMAMEKPVVSTTIGAEGLPLSDGAELLIADAPDEFASAIVRLLRDDELARSLAARAAAKVRELYGWDKVAEAFAAACLLAAESRGHNVEAKGSVRASLNNPTDRFAGTGAKS